MKWLVRFPRVSPREERLLLWRPIPRWELWLWRGIVLLNVGIMVAYVIGVP